MNEFLDVARTVGNACLIGIKEDPVTGIGITLVLIGLLLFPVLILVFLPKGLEQRSFSPEQMREENTRGLSSRTGRALTFSLAVILFSMAWAVRGLYILMVPLMLAGAASLYMALHPAAGASWFTPAPAGKGSPWLSYAVAVLLLMVSGWQFHLYLQASDAETNWVQVTGVIRDNGVSRSRSGGGGVLSVYTLHTTYSYEAGGTTYTSRPVEVDMETTHTDGQEALETLYTLYPKGGPVTVYYDPRNPANSTLGKAATGGLLFPVVFLLASLVAFISGRDRALKRKEPDTSRPAGPAF